MEGILVIGLEKQLLYKNKFLLILALNALKLS